MALLIFSICECCLLKRPKFERLPKLSSCQHVILLILTETSMEADCPDSTPDNQPLPFVSAYAAYHSVPCCTSAKSKGVANFASVTDDALAFALPCVASRSMLARYPSVALDVLPNRRTELPLPRNREKHTPALGWAQCHVSFG